MDLQAQELVFEKAYQEYKDYEKFVESISEDIAEERKNFSKYVNENSVGDDELFEKMFDINEKPSLHRIDLGILRIKLVHLYEAYKDLIEIPADVVKEINTFEQPKLMYSIKKGEAEEVNKEQIKIAKSNIKNIYLTYIKQVKGMPKNE